jgi:uncharacterized phage protein (TIGR01671 family)
MREIKFRAFELDNQSMHFSSEQEDSFVWEIQPNIKLLELRTVDTYPGGQYHEQKEEWIAPNQVLMQFTGLHDKNGKEIFEGDLVKIPDDYEKYGFFAGEIREIYFLDGCFRFKPKQQHVIDRGDRGATIQDDMECCEVIGNIYETKETQT